jgi:DNA gyrase subunit B
MGFEIEHVRKRPGMYVGSTTASGLHRIVLEPIANVVDLFMSGRAQTVSVDIDDDGYGFVVSDDGPSFGVADRDRATEVEGFFTSIHDTPTADGHAPHFHLDPINFGLGVVSALAESVEVRSGEGAQGVFAASFTPGKVTASFSRDPSAAFTQGARVAVRVDRGIFSEGIDRETLRKRLAELGPLMPGLKVVFNGTDLSGERTLGHLLAEFVNAKRSERTDLEPVQTEQFHEFEYGSGDRIVRGAIAWLSDRVYHPLVRTFCNFVELTEDGHEVRGIAEGLRLALGQAPVDRVLLGFVGVFSLEVDSAKIEGPTRGRLEDPKVMWLLADGLASAINSMAAKDPSLRDRLQARMPLRTPTVT